MQGFDCESITFKKSVNMFERMEIAESIYEGVLEISYKQSTRTYANRFANTRKQIGEAALSNTYSKMSESTIKYRKLYVDYQTGN